MSEAVVADRPERRRYEMDVDGTVAFVTYRWDGATLVLEHTEVPESLSGRGIGSALARGVLADARSRGLRVVPECEFMAAYIKRHPEFADLLAAGSGAAGV